MDGFDTSKNVPDAPVRIFDTTLRDGEQSPGASMNAAEKLRLAVQLEKLGVDALSFASNPFYGPTGVGGLYVRRGTMVWPLLDGGVQENNKRAGSENLIGIIGMAAAAEIRRATRPRRRTAHR